MTLASGLSVGCWRRSPEGGEKQLSLPITAQKNKSGGANDPSTYALPMDFLPHFAPASLSRRALKCRLVVQTRLETVKVVLSRRSMCRAATQPWPPSQPTGLLLRLHCSCCVIHHSCHNPICANITNKARVVYLTQNHNVVSWGRGRRLWDL